MNGAELKRIAEESNLSPVEICFEACICVPTLYKVFKGMPVRDVTKRKVERAILLLKHYKENQNG